MSSSLTVKLEGKDLLTPLIENVKEELGNIQKTGSRLDTIQQKFDRITNSTAPLSKRVRDIRKEMENLQMSGEHTTEQGQKMWAKLSETAKQYDAMLKKIQADTKSVGLESNAVCNGVGTKMDLKGLANGAGLGGAVSALANPYVLAGAAIASMTKALYDYNVQLDKSLNRTAQFTGLSGSELKDVRNYIKSVADTFGKDYNEVLDAVDGLMVQFGLNAYEAIKIIRDGFVAGADDGGKVLDLISKYGGAFNDAGISASELVAIIGNTRSGIFSEQGMELFAKGAKNIREFSNGLSASLTAVGINATEMYNKLQSGQMSTIQSIQEISSKLKDLNPQSKEVGDVMKEVFGRQGAGAGYELVTALADVSTNLEDVKKQTGEWGEAMQKLQEADRELESALSSLFGVANGGFETMSARLKTDVYLALAKVINTFIDLYNKCELVRGAIAKTKYDFQKTWEYIRMFLRISLDGFKDLGDVIQGVLNLDWQQVKQSWNNGISNLLKNVATGFANVAVAKAQMMDDLKNGKIDKIEIEAEETISESKKKPTGNAPQVTPTIPKVPTTNKTEVADKNSLQYAQDKVSELQKQLAKLDISSAEFENTKKALAEWQKIVEERQKAVKLSVGVEVDENSIKFAEQKVSELSAQLAKLDVASAEFETTKALLIEWQNILSERKKALANEKEITNEVKKQAQELTPTIQARNTKIEAQGDLADKRQSYQNAQANAQAIRADLELGLIDATQAREQLNSVITQLQTSFPDLTLDLKINSDGTITTAQEDLEKLSSAVSNVGSSFSSIGNAMASLANENEALTKAALVAQAIGQLTLSFAQSMKGTLTPWDWIAGAVSGTAVLASTVAQMQSFASGGIVGGTSFVGDKTLIRANSGEMVLNKTQQTNLYNAIKANDIGGSNLGGKVEFKIDGRQLKGVLSNVNSKTSRQS